MKRLTDKRKMEATLLNVNDAEASRLVRQYWFQRKPLASRALSGNPIADMVDTWAGFRQAHEDARAHQLTELVVEIP